MPTPDVDPTVVDPSVLAERRARRAVPAGDDALRARAEDAERRLIAAETERDALGERVRAAEAEVATIRRDGARELLRLRGALAGAEERAAVLQREVDELTRELSTSAGHAVSEAEVAALREELAQRTAAEERLTGELAAERARVAEAVEQIATALRTLPGGVPPVAFGARAAADHPALAAPAQSPSATTLADDIARARERLQAAAPADDATAEAAEPVEAAEPPATEVTEPPTAAVPSADTPSWLLTPPGPEAVAAAREAADVAARGRRPGLVALKVAAAALPVAAVVTAVELATR